jgi:uncharacterized protein (TIGR02217 family)
MSFLETPRFPDNVAYGTAGGPGYNTRVIDYGAGYEQRDIMWSYVRSEFDAAYGIRSIDDLYDVIAFFHVAKGRGHGFRFKDHSDYKSCEIEGTISATDQTIGTGDAAETEFQLIKTYTKGALSTIRYISKPVSGTVVVALNGTPQGSGWSVDTTTGIITFSSPPGGSVAVTAGYEFDVPVRFNIDKLSVVYSNYESGETSIPLVELKSHSVPAA